MFKSLNCLIRKFSTLSFHRSHLTWCATSVPNIQMPPYNGYKKSIKIMEHGNMCSLELKHQLEIQDVLRKLLINYCNLNEICEDLFRYLSAHIS